MSPYRGCTRRLRRALPGTRITSPLTPMPKPDPPRTAVGSLSLPMHPLQCPSPGPTRGEGGGGGGRKLVEPLGQRVLPDVHHRHHVAHGTLKPCGSAVVRGKRCACVAAVAAEGGGGLATLASVCCHPCVVPKQQALRRPAPARPCPRPTVDVRRDVDGGAADARGAAPRLDPVALHGCHLRGSAGRGAGQAGGR